MIRSAERMRKLLWTSRSNWMPSMIAEAVTELPSFANGCAVLALPEKGEEGCRPQRWGRQREGRDLVDITTRPYAAPPDTQRGPNRPPVHPPCSQREARLVRALVAPCRGSQPCPGDGRSRRNGTTGRR